MLRLTLRLVLRATAPSVAGRWSAMFGNGRPLTSRRFRASPLTLMKTIHSHGSARGGYCAAGAGRQAHGSLAPHTEISLLPTEMTYLRGSAPALFDIALSKNTLANRREQDHKSLAEP